MNYCIDCGKEIYHESRRCQECYHKSRNKNNYPDKNYCLGCGKEIDKRSKRCYSCSNKINPLKYNILESYLQKEYIDNKKSLVKIAKELNCSSIVIKNRLVEFNIQRRSRGEAITGNLNPMFGVFLKGNKNGNYKSGKYCKDKKYYCIICGKQISADSKSGKCCKCKYSNPIDSPNWQGGISFEPYSIEWTEELKEYIRQRDNYICQNPECKYPQLENGPSLHVHHIDYIKENCNEYNLISLCHSCHSKTNVNRDYWFAYYKYIMEEKKCQV